MIVELISVGTELLIGQIDNTNATHIGRRLNEEGFDSHFQVCVGDDLALLTSAIETALGRADAVILTGGIGPTQDDLTREALCEVGAREMTTDTSHAEWIRRRVLDLGREPNDTVLRMANLPEGSEPLPNSVGLALGVVMEHKGKHLFALPGVPTEMKPMLDHEVIPRLLDIGGGPQVLLNRTIRLWDLGESDVASLLDDLFVSTNPTLAFLIADMEVQVRITARAESEQTASKLVDAMQREVLARVGDAFFGVDDETVESKIVETLISRNWTLGTMELATLGQVGARIAATEGARAVYRGSVVAPLYRGKPAPPDADVLLFVGNVSSQPSEGASTARPVEMRVVTPSRETGRVFSFGGSDERLRAFATIAGLHMIRLAISD